MNRILSCRSVDGCASSAPQSGDLSLDEINKLSIDFLEVRMKKVKEALKQSQSPLKIDHYALCCPPPTFFLLWIV